MKLKKAIIALVLGTTISTGGFATNLYAANPVQPYVKLNSDYTNIKNGNYYYSLTRCATGKGKTLTFTGPAINIAPSGIEVRDYDGTGKYKIIPIYDMVSYPSNRNIPYAKLNANIYGTTITVYNINNTSISDGSNKEAEIYLKINSIGKISSSMEFTYKIN